MKTTSRLRFLQLALLLFTLLGFLLSLKLGPVKTSLDEVFRAIISGKSELTDIILGLRLPRALLAYLVGTCLSLSGAILQGYFRNPLADPFILGASSGASLGAVLSLQLGLVLNLAGLSAQSLLALLASLLLVSGVYLISERRRFQTTESLLLTGIAAGALASALTSFLLFHRADAYEQAVFWLLGSFSLAEWQQVWLILGTLVLAVLVSQYLARDMNLLSLGDETARSLGCPVRSVRRVFLLLATLLASFSVSVAGIIGFVGLIVPHGVRLIVGPDHRRLFLHSALAGGLFLLVSDLLARLVLAPSELPVGVVTAAFGAPFFIYLLNRPHSS
ncbi:MAG: iron ABC transporter permease [Candidatus Aminicenantes bacterium]|uniref:Vitamin B12 ABC transporter, permease component BtuC n=1 Tax=Candidatus Saccharicenans subterraneus TaxID=2508984 RepID=A0A3E2BNF3_9BACT|nr:iron ABC transporter permease [Candidatus Aminicenantes bacterium]RFT16241.1 MAG: Vitamin B12 ABC transporter, permease component BtuC [Candidatus Saccharicenans subterraneum]